MTMRTRTLTVVLTLLVSHSDAFIIPGRTSIKPILSDLFRCDLMPVPRQSSMIIATGAMMKPIDSSSSSQLNSTKVASTVTAARQLRIDDADRIFDSVDVDKSNTVSLQELTAHFSTAGIYSPDSIQRMFSTMDGNDDGEISRDEFRKRLVEEPSTERDVDLIFTVVDVDESGAIDLEELTEHLVSAGYENREEIEQLFKRMDCDNNGKISRNEFRRAILDDTSSTGEEDICPRGYFLNSVQQTCQRLGPIGRLSQRLETLGPFKRTYLAISNLFGLDTKKISKHGISFFLSYSIISNISTSISLSVAWYISCKRTGLSPLVPGQWKSLLASYGMIYGMIQLLKPFRVAAAMGMSKLSAEYLELTQTKFQCSRGVAIGMQFVSGQVIMGICAAVGVSLASLLTGVKVL